MYESIGIKTSFLWYMYFQKEVVYYKVILYENLDIQTGKTFQKGIVVLFTNIHVVYTNVDREICHFFVESCFRGVFL